MMTSAIETDAHIEEAALFLDQEKDGWWRRVKDTGPGFSIFHSENCLLKQVFGDYSVGMDSLRNAGMDFAVSLAFSCSVYEDQWYTDAWRREVQKRNEEDERHARELVDDIEVQEERELILATR